MKFRQRFRLPTIARSVALQLFVCFFFIYAVTSSGGLEAIDSEVRYQTAKSWLEGNGGALLLGDELTVCRVSTGATTRSMVRFSRC